MKKTNEPAPVAAAAPVVDREQATCLRLWLPVVSARGPSGQVPELSLGVMGQAARLSGRRSAAADGQSQTARRRFHQRDRSRGDGATRDASGSQFGAPKMKTRPIDRARAEMSASRERWR